MDSYQVVRLVSNIHNSRWKRNKTSHSTEFEQYQCDHAKHRTDSAFVTLFHLCRLPGLIRSHRRTVTTGHPEMALSAGSVHKSQRRLQCATSGDSHLVFRRQYLQGVEIFPIFLMGPWQTFVSIILRNSNIHGFLSFIAGSGKSILWYANSLLFVPGD